MKALYGACCIDELHVSFFFVQLVQLNAHLRFSYCLSIKSFECALCFSLTIVLHWSFYSDEVRQVLLQIKSSIMNKDWVWQWEVWSLEVQRSQWLLQHWEQRCWMFALSCLMGQTPNKPRDWWKDECFRGLNVLNFWADGMQPAVLHRGLNVKILLHQQVSANM